MACPWSFDTGTRALLSWLYEYCSASLKKQLCLASFSGEFQHQRPVCMCVCETPCSLYSKMIQGTFRDGPRTYAPEEMALRRRIPFVEHLLFDAHRQVDHRKFGKESWCLPVPTSAFSIGDRGLTDSVLKKNSLCRGLINTFQQNFLW